MKDRWVYLVATFILSLSCSSIFAISYFGQSKVTSVNQTAPMDNAVDYALVIVMENHSFNSIIGSSSAPYLNMLANSYSLLTHYSYLHSPSLPNYLALLAGSTFDCTTDVYPNSNTCTDTAWASMNLVDSLEAKGYSWKAYMEDMPSNCYMSDAGTYYVRHDPFVYFGDIVNNPNRCSRVVPSGPGDNTLLSDLQSTTTSSNFMWFTPNGCNDMHNCSVSTGDDYLGQLIPQILISTVFNTQKAAIFLTFDEGDLSSSNNYVYTVWAGPAAKQKYQSSNNYNHYSLLKTLEATWALTGLAQEDPSASPMTELLSAYRAPPNTPPSVPVTTLVAMTAGVVAVFTMGIIGIVTRTRRRRLATEGSSPGRQLILEGLFVSDDAWNSLVTIRF